MRLTETRAPLSLCRALVRPPRPCARPLTVTPYSASPSSGRPTCREGASLRAVRVSRSSHSCGAAARAACPPRSSRPSVYMAWRRGSLTAARCSRIWCVRPLCGDASTSDTPPWPPGCPCPAAAAPCSAAPPPSAATAPPAAPAPRAMRGSPASPAAATPAGPASAANCPNHPSPAQLLLPLLLPLQLLVPSLPSPPLPACPPPDPSAGPSRGGPGREASTAHEVDAGWPGGTQARGQQHKGE
jgi:hypothetical protein